DLDSGGRLQRVAITAQALIHITVARDRENRHVALPIKFFGYTLAAVQSSLVLVRANEEQAFAGWRVGIDSDYGNASRNSMVDIILHQSRVDYRDQNSCGFLLNRFLQSLLLGLGVVTVRAIEFGAHL